MFNGSLGVLCRGRALDRWSFCYWVVETAMLQDGFGALAQNRPPRWSVAAGVAGGLSFRRRQPWVRFRALGVLFPALWYLRASQGPVD